MKLSIKNLKKLSIAFVILPLCAIVLAGPSPLATRAAADDFDAAATFKAKCALCHGADASKKFDATKADDVLVDTVMKGRDVTPIKMPSYEAKGMTADQAKALVAYV